MTSSEAESGGGGIAFRVGWWVLLVLSGLFALNHVLGVVTFATSDDERFMFLVFAALGVLSLFVLLFAYRRGEFWAWWAMWVPVVVMAAPLVVFPADGLGVMYGAVAVVMALAQFATLSELRRARTEAVQTAA